LSSSSIRIDSCLFAGFYGGNAVLNLQIGGPIYLSSVKIAQISPSSDYSAVFEAIKQQSPSQGDPSGYFAEYGSDWYSASANYWSHQEPSVNGMLGGFEEVAPVDIRAARDAIHKYQTRQGDVMGKQAVADCACGIGRVSKFALCDYFEEIDLIDAIPEFVDQAAEILSHANVKVRKIVSGLQDWVPDRDYDAFWIQWGLMYMIDEDCVKFLIRCRDHLKPNGLIFVKENLVTDDVKAARDSATFQKEARAVCRTYSHYRELFRAAGLGVVEWKRVSPWPAHMMPVCTFVLK
jgi:protein N-terminal methyltransferase